jgi:beta-xylosidase
MKPFFRFAILCSLALFLIIQPLRAANPAITGVFTADPAALVYNGTVYLYTGHDQPPEKQQRYVMKEWLCFSSTDMVHWAPHPSPLAVKDFTWAKADAWAGQVIDANGKFYWFVPVSHKTIHGFSIGVGVSDSPTGPFKDAIGSALITSAMTPYPKNAEGKTVTWNDIDPTLFRDDDGQSYLMWGTTKCYWVKLKPSMTEIDGPIQTVDNLPGYTESPWLHKHNGIYYLSYSQGFPEKTAYATSDHITGPWTFRGVIQDLAKNCNTNHQAIIEFKGKSYFIYHDGALPGGGSFRRSVCIDYLYYNPDGTIKPIVQTDEGVSPAQ